MTGAVAPRAVLLTGALLEGVALPYQTYELTNSTLAVGLLGAAELVPALIVVFAAGALADLFAHRRSIKLARAGAALAAAILLANALSDRPQIWVVYVASVLGAASFTLVRSSHAHIRFPAAAVAGPALGGLLVAAAGLTSAYALATGVFAFALPFAGPPGARAAGREDGPERRPGHLRAGLRHFRAHAELGGSYLVTLAAAVFATPTALLPSVAEHFGGATALGALAAASPVGALAVAPLTRHVAAARRPGRAVVATTAASGAAVVGFAFAGRLWLALALLAAAGCARAFSSAGRAHIRSVTTGADLAGRVAGVHAAAETTGLALGHTEAGTLGLLAGPRTAAALGGGACVLAAVAVAAAVPALWSYSASGQAERT